MQRTHISRANGHHSLGHQKRRLLLVNENIEDLLYYTAILQNFGYETRPCPTYAEAIEHFQRESYDLIIISQGSRAFEGRSVLARAVEANQKAPVLVLARPADIDCYIEAMQMGANDYLEEPLSPSEVLEQVERHMRTDGKGHPGNYSAEMQRGGRRVAEKSQD
jgi:DNA-binding response OmpR family regulator